MGLHPAGLWLHLEEELPASAPRVFESLTDPSQLREWWGPNDFTIPSIDLDPKVDGRYRFTMQPPAGEPFHLQGEFLEVDAPHRIHFTFRWEEPDPEDVETVVHLVLLDLGSSTRISVDQGAFATQRRRELHLGGWTDSLQKLKTLLARG